MFYVDSMHAETLGTVELFLYDADLQISLYDTESMPAHDHKITI